MKRVLILGVNSYIGTSFDAYVKRCQRGQFCVDCVSLHGSDWRNMDWSVYDSVINVTGKAHADLHRLGETEKREYYEINCGLACRTAKKAISDGAGQYIYPSSIIVYGDSSNRQEARVISLDSQPAPSNFYGDSKWKAEQGLQKIFSKRKSRTRLAVLRLPMIYGSGCKGNYQTLARLAKKIFVFPDYKNRRSMLYIENLCELICLLIENNEEGLFFPQDEKYVSTSRMVQLIAEEHGRRITCVSGLNPVIDAAKRFPGRIGGIVKKAFGSLTYEKGMSVYPNGEYRKYTLEESIRRTERGYSFFQEGQLRGMK